MLSAVGAATGALQGTAPGQLAPAAPAAPSLLTDLIPAASDWYPEALRKTSYDHSCHKPDHLASAAGLVSGLAKVLLAVAALLLVKLLTIKMLFLPAKLMFLAKIGFKAMLLYPIMSKIIKLWKKKKKGLSKEGRVPAIDQDRQDCGECLLTRAARGGWAARLAALAGLSLDDDAGDSPYLLTLMETLSPGDVAACVPFECGDIAL